jgi:hypothetical protein
MQLALSLCLFPLRLVVCLRGDLTRFRSSEIPSLFDKMKLQVFVYAAVAIASLMGPADAKCGTIQKMLAMTRCRGTRYPAKSSTKCLVRRIVNCPASRCSAARCPILRHNPKNASHVRLWSSRMIPIGSPEMACVAARRLLFTSFFLRRMQDSSSLPTRSILQCDVEEIKVNKNNHRRYLQHQKMINISSLFEDP